MKSMKRLTAIVLLAVSSVSALPLAGSADVTLSQSNNPNAALGLELSALIDQETTQTADEAQKPIEQFLAAFKPEEKPTPPVHVEYTRDFLDHLPEASGGDQWECLTEALYFEARGETVKGQFAVAEVILNRVASSRFPNTVCKVVNQGTGKKFQCQFTYTCDGLAEAVNEEDAHSRAAKIARLMLDGAPKRLTEGATHYHTTAVSPYWAHKFAKTTSIGAHLFYRMPRA